MVRCRHDVGHRTGTPHRGGHGSRDTPVDEPRHRDHRHKKTTHVDRLSHGTERKFADIKIVSEFRNPNKIVKDDITKRSKRSLTTFQGACKPGWVKARIDNKPVCIFVNEKRLSWDDAKDECRKDFGFLLKLEGSVTVEDENNVPIQHYLQRQSEFIIR